MALHMQFDIPAQGKAMVAQMSGMDHSHSCCGVAGSIDDNVNDMFGAHEVASTYILSLGASFIFMALLVVWVLQSRLVIPLQLYGHLYMQRWHMRVRYFSLYITRLFSQGILHTQIW